MGIVEKLIESEWESAYSSGQTPWESGKPEPELVKLVTRGIVGKGRALDLGCGMGTNSIYLAKKGFEVYGLDIAANALQIARKRARQAGVKCRFKRGLAWDLHKSGFGNGFFDFVFDRGCFHHIPAEHRGEFAREINRVLKKSGKYHVMAFSKRNGFGTTFSIDDIRKIFSKSFDIKSAKEVTYVDTDGDKVFLNSVLMQRK